MQGQSGSDGFATDAPVYTDFYDPLSGDVLETEPAAGGGGVELPGLGDVAAPLAPDRDNDVGFAIGPEPNGGGAGYGDDFDPFGLEAANEDDSDIPGVGGLL